MFQPRRLMPPPLVNGAVINDRYEIREMLGKGGMGEVFLAHDRAAQMPVALKIIREDARMPGDDDLLRREMINARRVPSPYVCRVYDLVPSEYGPILVMEYIDGKTLHAHIRDQNARGGYTCDDLRRIAANVCEGVAAIHAARLVHGDIKPGNVMITSNPDGSLDKALLLDFGFALDPGQTGRGPNGIPDGGTANYQSPERIDSGTASVEDDLYALGLTLWEMWTCAVPEPGANPRHQAMPRQTKYDVLAGLSVDEIKQIFWCLSEDPAQRIAARNLRFFNPTTISISATPVRREKLDARAPPGSNSAGSFVSGAQSLLVTFAPNTPALVGDIFLLDRPTLTVGRRDDMNIVLREPTVSGHHATLTWGTGAWQLEDVGSTSGTYVDYYPYTPRKTVTLRHSAEVQLGELRLKLVGFEPGSRPHARARAFLARRDGLTGLLTRERFEPALIEECLFSDWAEQPLSVARFEISTPKEPPTERPTISELLGLRQAATRVVEVIDGLMLSLIAVTAGRTGPRGFAVIVIGPKLKESQNLVDHVVDQVRRTLPQGLDLTASVFHYEPDTDPRWLIGPG